MASPIRTGMTTGLGIAIGAGAAALAGAGLYLGDDGIARFGLNGQAVLSLLPVQALLLLTLVFYLLAIAVPHTRLALVQAIVIGLWGIAMVVAGLILLMAGLVGFAAKLALLFAFPFGTIAYFALYSCTEGDLQPLVEAAAQVLGGGCMTGTQLVALAALMLKSVVLVLLLIASPRFLKVTGLLVLFAVCAGLGAAVIAGYWMLSDLHFLLYPLDGLVTAGLGLVVAIYGAVSFVKSLFALALAIAGQIG